MTSSVDPSGPEPIPSAHVDAEWRGLKADVGDLADVAASRSRGFADAARAQAVQYVDQRKGGAAQSVTDLARSVRDSGKNFQDQPNIHAFFDNAAEGLDQLAGTIRDRSIEDLYRDLEGVVRRRPAVVAAATFATGFLIARFIKASAANVAQPSAYVVDPIDTVTGPQA